MEDRPSWNAACCQAGIIPNLDSIAGFRILTSNADGRIWRLRRRHVNVFTKSGANEFHGSAFEFLSNTHLDARILLAHALGEE